MIIFLQFEIPSKSFLELLLTTHLKFVEALLSLEYTPLEPCFGILYQTLTHMRRGRPLSSVFYPLPHLGHINLPLSGAMEKELCISIESLELFVLGGSYEKSNFETVVDDTVLFYFLHTFQKVLTRHSGVQHRYSIRKCP